MWAMLASPVASMMILAPRSARHADHLRFEQQRGAGIDRLALQQQFDRLGVDEIPGRLPGGLKVALDLGGETFVQLPQIDAVAHPRRDLRPHARPTEERQRLDQQNTQPQPPRDDGGRAAGGTAACDDHVKRAQRRKRLHVGEMGRTNDDLGCGTAHGRSRSCQNAPAL
jgi:hypothetical protein